MATYYRTDNARIQVSVTGIVLDSVSWDMMDGGEIVAETTNYNPGGMEPAVELGGLSKRSDMTVERIWSDALIAVYKQLDNACGETAGSIGYTVLAKGVTVPGSAVTYTGVLKGVARPGYNSSSSAEAKLVLTFGLNRNLS